MPLTYEERQRILSNSAVRGWISNRAYELYQLGGYQQGKAAEDWKVAESELLALATLFESFFRKATRQPVRQRSDSKTGPKPKQRQTRSRKAPAPKVSPISDDTKASQDETNVEQVSPKKKKPR